MILEKGVRHTWKRERQYARAWHEVQCRAFKSCSRLCYSLHPLSPWAHIVTLSLPLGSALLPDPWPEFMAYVLLQCLYGQRSMT